MLGNCVCVCLGKKDILQLKNKSIIYTCQMNDNLERGWDDRIIVMKQ